jgi:hypothetical protein
MAGIAKLEKKDFRRFSIKWRIERGNDQNDSYLKWKGNCTKD